VCIRGVMVREVGQMAQAFCPQRCHALAHDVKFCLPPGAFGAPVGVVVWRGARARPAPVPRSRQRGVGAGGVRDDAHGSMLMGCGASCCGGAMCVPGRCWRGVVSQL
jgi:hypothetical protein